MKIIATGLKTEIMNGTIANLVKITTENNTIYGYTDHDSDLTVDGVTYISAPGLQKIRMASDSSAKVSNQEFGSAWVDAPEEDVLAGKFDNATIEVLWVSWNDVSQGTVSTFKGNLGVLNWNEEGFRADIHSTMRSLARNIGFQYTAQCRHKLFGATGTDANMGACSLISTSFTWNATVTDVSRDKILFEVSNGSAIDGMCSYGVAKFTSGANNDYSYEIKTYKVGAFTTVELALPSAYTIQVGDTVTLTAGCDKSLETCKGKFNNVVNFGGFPHIQTEINIR